MKHSFIAILIVFFVSASVKAQTENTSERLVTQLKNGTAPGLQFARHVPASKVEDNKVEQKESLVAQIRKGTAPGMKFMMGAAGSAALKVAPNASRTKTGTLASEQQIQKEALKTVSAPPAIPTQEEVKQENKQ